MTETIIVVAHFDAFTKHDQDSLWFVINITNISYSSHHHKLQAHENQIKTTPFFLVINETP